LDNRQKLLIGAAIVILLLLLLGAFAMSGSKNDATATPTPTPVPTVTPTPTPVPPGGPDTGAGTATPTATPVPTATPTPTPAPRPTMGVQMYDSTWPSYNYQWSPKPGETTPVVNVSFVLPMGYLYVYEGINYELWDDGWHESTDGDYEANATVVLLAVPVAREGDLSGSTTVTATYVSDWAGGDASEILGIMPAEFAPGEAEAIMGILVDREWLEYTAGGDDPVNCDEVIFTIENSAYYSVVEDKGEFELVINIG
jgi:hypothetical protein